MVAHLTPAGSMILEWICTGIALLFVLLRLYVRWVQRIFTISDLIVVISWCTFAYLTALNHWIFVLGVWGAPGVNFAPTGFTGAREIVNNDAKLVLIYKLFYAGGLFYYISLWGIKAAFLLLYYQMVARTQTRLRIVLHITSALTAGSFFVLVMFNFVWCLPIQRVSEPDESKHCWPFPSLGPYFTCLGMHLLTDVLIYTIPFPLIGSLLGFTFRQRLGVGVMFALGGLSILCTVGRSISIGDSFSMISVGAWTSAEQATAIAVCCCPPLKWLYKNRRPWAAPANMAKHSSYSRNMGTGDSEWGTYSVNRSSVGGGGPGRDLEQGRINSVGGNGIVWNMRSGSPSENLRPDIIEKRQVVVNGSQPSSDEVSSTSDRRRSWLGYLRWPPRWSRSSPTPPPTVVSSVDNDVPLRVNKRNSVLLEVGDRVDLSSQ